jgi:hypothetical protein
MTSDEGHRAELARREISPEQFTHRLHLIQGATP